MKGCFLTMRAVHARRCRSSAPARSCNIGGTFGLRGRALRMALFGLQMGPARHHQGLRPRSSGPTTSTSTTSAPAWSTGRASARCARAWPSGWASRMEEAHAQARRGVCFEARLDRRGHRQRGAVLRERRLAPDHRRRTSRSTADGSSERRPWKPTSSFAAVRSSPPTAVFRSRRRDRRREDRRRRRRPSAGKQDHRRRRQVRHARRDRQPRPLPRARATTTRKTGRPAPARAARGGVTTVLEMPNTNPPTGTLEALQVKQGIAARQAYVDYGIYGLLDENNLDQLEALTDGRRVGLQVLHGQHLRRPAGAFRRRDARGLRDPRAPAA